MLRKNLKIALFGGVLLAIALGLLLLRDEPLIPHAPTSVESAGQTVIDSPLPSDNAETAKGGEAVTAAESQATTDRGSGTNMQEPDPAYVAAHFDEYARAAAQGDASAARILYRALRNCSAGINSENALKERLLTIKKLRLDPKNTQFADHTEREVRDQYGRCRYFTSQQVATRLKMLELAAQAGDNEASQLFYLEGDRTIASDPLAPVSRAEYREKAVRLLSDAVDRGDPFSAHLLAEIFDSGRWASRDAARAYEYLYLYSLTRTNQGAPKEEFLFNRLSRLVTELTPDQRQAAEAAALRRVQNCCH